jgi:nitrite reductase/ring-hydroxylating ferredoxin subunit
MATGSKIRYFFILAAISIMTVSCNRNKNDVIPDVPVDFTINLNDPEFVNLTTLFGSVYINSSTNNWGINSAGYNGNGIIVFAGPDEFYAYDRTCPHDYAVNNINARVYIDDQIYAECPSCKTKYALTNFGTPISDTIGRYPLKNYRTSLNGNYVTVWNY